jgi:hypothetical protein
MFELLRRWIQWGFPVDVLSVGALRWVRIGYDGIAVPSPRS